MNDKFLNLWRGSLKKCMDEMLAIWQGVIEDQGKVSLSIPARTCVMALSRHRERVLGGMADRPFHESLLMAEHVMTMMLFRMIVTSLCEGAFEGGSGRSVRHLSDEVEKLRASIGETFGDAFLDQADIHHPAQKP